MAESQEKLRMGIEAARRGDKAAAEVLLREVVAATPNNELAWMWLASVVDNVRERRQYLERALLINPRNQRAREALDRLPPPEDGEAVPVRMPPLPAAADPEPLRETGSGPGLFNIIIGAIVLVAVIGAVIFGVVFAQQSNIFSPATEVPPEAILNPTATATIDPATYTDTPIYGIPVTRSTEDFDLPPTFTPTASPTPTDTPTPTATPIPPSTFTLLYTAFVAGEDQPRLFRASGDGTDVEELGAGFRDVVYHPAGDSIAFVRDVVTVIEGEGDEEDVTLTGSELFVADLDDLENARQVTTLGGMVSSPTWAPDGIQLAFVADFSGTDQIWTMTEDGNNLRQVTEDGINRDPAWSPNGGRIVFISDRDSPGVTKLYSMTPDGENVIQLFGAGGSSYSPHWSPDGRRIVFINDGNGDGDIYMTDADGQRPILLTPDDDGAEDRWPVFTPDMRLVAFISNRGGDTFDLFQVDLQGSTPAALPGNDHDEQSLDYRPEVTLRLRQD